MCTTDSKLCRFRNMFCKIKYIVFKIKILILNLSFLDFAVFGSVIKTTRRKNTNLTTHDQLNIT